MLASKLLAICQRGVKNINDVKVLRNVDNINFLGEGGTTLLSTAMTNKHPDIIYFLISKGANFCGKERQIVNYLVQLNCRKYDLKLRVRKLKYLLEDPIHEILRCLSEEDQEQYLLAHRIIGFRDSKKKNDISDISDFFFNKYVEERHFQSIYFLDDIIKKGANINNQLKNGDTALHFACENSYFHLSEFLIKSGAETNIRNNKGNVALSLFIDKGCLEYDSFDEYLIAMVKKSRKEQKEKLIVSKIPLNEECLTHLFVEDSIMNKYKTLYELHMTQQWKRRISFIYVLLGNEILFILNRISYERQEEIKKINDKNNSPEQKVIQRVFNEFFLRIEICQWI